MTWSPEGPGDVGTRVAETLAAGLPDDVTVDVRRGRTFPGAGPSLQVMAWRRRGDGSWGSSKTKVSLHVHFEQPSFEVSFSDTLAKVVAIECPGIKTPPDVQAVLAEVPDAVLRIMSGYLRGRGQ